MPPRPIITASCIFLIGLFQIIGGVWLSVLGGSWFYLISGLLWAGAAIALWQRRVFGRNLYFLTLLGTAVWAVSEAGLDMWALVPRLGIPVLIGAWLSTPWINRQLN